MTARTETNWGEAQAQRLERVHEQLAALLNQPDVAERLRTAPGESEWSALEVLPYLRGSRIWTFDNVNPDQRTSS